MCQSQNLDTGLTEGLNGLETFGQVFRRGQRPLPIKERVQKEREYAQRLQKIQVYRWRFGELP